LIHLLIQAALLVGVSLAQLAGLEVVHLLLLEPQAIRLPPPQFKVIKAVMALNFYTLAAAAQFMVIMLGAVEELAQLVLMVAYQVQAVTGGRALLG